MSDLLLPKYNLDLILELLNNSDTIDDIQSVINSFKDIGPKGVFYKDQNDQSLFTRLIDRISQILDNQPENIGVISITVESLLSIFTSDFQDLNELITFLGIRVHEDFLKIGTIASEFIAAIDHLADHFEIPLLLINIPVPQSEPKLALALCNINPSGKSENIKETLVEGVPVFLENMRQGKEGHVLGIFITNVPLRKVITGATESKETFQILRDSARKKKILLDALVVDDSGIVGFAAKALSLMIGNTHVAAVPSSQVHASIEKRISMSSQELIQRDEAAEG